MKRKIAFLLSVILAVSLAGCASRKTVSEDPIVSRTEQNSVYGTEVPGSTEGVVLSDGKLVEYTHQVLAANTVAEMRGVWFAYVNYRDVITGNTKAQFAANMDKIFSNIAGSGFNTVFAQVRPFGDALYDSAYFPWSRYLTGTEGKNPGYDPLEIMCQLADRHGLRIEAWINPYRVRTDARPLSADNPARKWIEAGDSAALKWGDGIYYNPGNEKARNLIVNGVREIVENYEVDGIHFDDYFYPTTNMSFDAATYKASGSKLTQANWRRENVNILIRQVYAAVKEANPDCAFGISPQGNMENNYDGQFIDCAKWLSEEGYVDYIMPQIYYGFQNGKNPFAATVQKWNDLIKNNHTKLYIGIGAYKLGAEDVWAGEQGKREWINTSNLLARMVETARKAENYGGVALYNYDSLFLKPSAQTQKEVAGLETLFS